MIALLCLAVVLFSIFAATHVRGDEIGDGWLLTAFGWLTLVSYLPVWSASFVYEDTHWLPIWQGGVLPSFAWIAYLPWVVATKIGGGAPWAYHGMALSVHLVNGLLLYLLIRRHVDAAVWAVGLFWLWPTNVEAVAYLSGAREALVAFWTLLGLCIVGSRDYPWERLLKLAGVLLCMGAAVATKSSGIVAVALLPLGAWWLNPRFVTRSAWAVLLIMALALPAVWSVWHVAQSEAVIDIGWHPRYAAATMTALWSYLAPFGLSVDHDWTPVPGVVLYVCGLGLSVVALAILSQWKRIPLVAAAVFWALVAVSPRFVIQQGDVMTEHNVYLAYLGVWPMFATALSLCSIPDLKRVWS